MHTVLTKMIQYVWIGQSHDYGSTKQERYSSSNGIVAVGDSKNSLVYHSATIVQTNII